MHQIIAVRSKIEEINAAYEEKVKPLKLALRELEQHKLDELVDLNHNYDVLCEQVVDDFKNGTLEKISGVSVRTLNDFEIIDPNEVPLEYYEWVLSKSKIKEQLKESDFTEEIPGVKTFKKYSVAVKL